MKRQARSLLERFEWLFPLRGRWLRLAWGGALLMAGAFITLGSLGTCLMLGHTIAPNGTPVAQPEWYFYGLWVAGLAGIGLALVGLVYLGRNCHEDSDE